MGWLDDIRYAVRRLARSPGFSAIAIAILVLGIGVNASAFGLVNALLLQPPPFPEPDRLVDLLQDSDDGVPNSTSYPAYEDIRRVPGLFQAVAAVAGSETFLEQDGSFVSLATEFATADYMRVLGLSPVMGRWFDDLEDDPAGPPTAVLSHRWWKNRLGSDPDVVGRTLRINGAAITVVGVGPEEFNGGAGPAVADIWLSISALRPTGSFIARGLTRREDHPFFVRARLLDGVTVETVRSRMDRLASELATTYPEVNANRGLHTIPVGDIRIHPSIDAQLVPAASLLMGVVLLVLFIATLNLANLLLVRTTARAREIAVRLAMGAGRARVTRVIVSEAVVLSLVGGAGGFAVAVWAVGAIDAGTLPLPVAIDVRLDGAVLGFSALVTLGSGLVFGLLPALRVTRRDVNRSLRDEEGVAIGSRRRLGLTGLLVSGQIAASLLLLAIAGVFLDSLIQARGADPGFDYERTAFVSVSLNPLGLDSDGASAFLRTLDERLEATPEVDRAAVAMQLPGAQYGTTTMLLGAGIDGVDRPREIPWNQVDLEYFDVLGVDLLHGRLFQPGDEGAPVVVVSEAFARTYFGRSDIVGERLLRESQPDEPQEVIGIVEDAAVRSLGESPTPSLYWPYFGGSGARAHLVVSTDGDPTRTASAARRIIREADARVMITASMTMEDHLGSTLSQQRLAGGVLGTIGALALVLAVLGLYGVVSFAVSRRQREVGIRQALGAGGSEVVRLFLRDVAGVVGLGAAVGLALAIPGASLVARGFTGGPVNPVVLGGVSLLLVATALLATAVPATRAARSSPRSVLARE